VAVAVRGIERDRVMVRGMIFDRFLSMEPFCRGVKNGQPLAVYT
jgi:hypothetical protein